MFYCLTDNKYVKAYFKNKELEKLYTTKKSKKYKLEQHVIGGFFEVVAIIRAAKDIYDFRKKPSLNFKKMQGTKNRYSLRIDKKYRLEVEIDWEDKHKTVGIIGIDEVSNHYR